MKNRKIKYYIILILSFGSLIGWEIMKPKPIDWTFSLYHKDKIPYGTYVIYNTLKEVFPGQKIKTNNLTLYEYSKKQAPLNKNFIFIVDDFNPDSLEIKQLLNFAQAGNNIFISANKINKMFSDTLGFEVSYYFNFESKSMNYNFVNPKLIKKNGYTYKKAFDNYYFSKVDTVNSKLIGIKNKILVNFIRQKYGNGEFFISTDPIVFTNYNLLYDNNSDYAYKALSHLPLREIIWDTSSHKDNDLEASPLRYILKNKALKYAYYLLMISIIFYMFLTAKRRQRVIPVMKPYQNTSLEFIETIGRLYLHGKNHKDIAIKKFNYFCEFVRLKYYINIKNPDDFSTEKFAEKTETNIELIQQILSVSKEIDNSQTITDKQLLELNKLIEQFYKECK